MANKSAVILWLYHTDLADEFVELLKPHEKYVDIFLGVCKDHDNHRVESLFKDNFSNVYLEYLNNAGTDVLPTLNLLEKCTDYPHLFKLHSKKNNWGTNRQVNWRVLLCNDILYKDNFKWTLDRLKQDHIGIVASNSMIMRNNEYTNINKIAEIVDIIGLDYSRLRIKSFIGGNIFAIKTKLLLPFINQPKLKKILSQEIGLIKDDDGGTYVHSMERLFGYMAEYNNKTICGAPCKTQIILNPRLKTHRLHLIKLYNNECYVQENPEVYGSILDDNDTYMRISWKNQDITTIRLYKKLNNKYLINYDYA